MEALFDTVRPVVSGLIGALCLYLLVRFTKPTARSEKGKKFLEYGRLLKIFTAALIPFSVFVAYGAGQAEDSQHIIALAVAAFFLMSAVFLGYQVFLVRFGYDDDFIYYRSPLCGEKKVHWSALADVGHSSLLQANYIVVKGIGRIWCSHMLNGYEEFEVFLENKTKELFPGN